MLEDFKFGCKYDYLLERLYGIQYEKVNELKKQRKIKKKNINIE